MTTPPPQPPCECGHPEDDHFEGQCQVDGCDCTEYLPKIEIEDLFS
jgi:hypothetical protein